MNDEHFILVFDLKRSFFRGVYGIAHKIYYKDLRRIEDDPVLRKFWEEVITECYRQRAQEYLFRQSAVFFTNWEENITKPIDEVISLQLMNLTTQFVTTGVKYAITYPFEDYIRGKLCTGIRTKLGLSSCVVEYMSIGALIIDYPLFPKKYKRSILIDEEKFPKEFELRTYRYRSEFDHFMTAFSEDRGNLVSVKENKLFDPKIFSLVKEFV